MKNILIVSHSPLHRDPRVLRQINALVGDYRIHTLGLTPPNVTGVRHTTITATRSSRAQRAFLLASRRFEQFYWTKFGFLNHLQQFQSTEFHAIVANDINTLPFALRIRNRGKLIFDAHEFSPRQFDDVLSWRLLFKPFVEYLCSEYLKSVDIMLTISPGLASAYARDYGVMPLVVSNAPDFFDLKPSTTDPRSIRLVHHGSAMPSRRLENLVGAMRFLDSRYSLDLILVVPPSKEKYYAMLKKKASRDSRISFLAPVPFGQIVPTLNRYDIGIYSLPPTNFNNAHALPNKFFEFIQARLAVAIGPSTEMSNLVRAHDLGEVASDFSSRMLSAAIGKMDLSRITTCKANSHAAAGEMSAEQNTELIRQIVR